MDEIITVDHLRRNFGDIAALREVNFSVRKGEVFGYIGPNGAGKTTTIRILLGLLRPTGGRVAVLGFDPANDEPAFRKNIAALLEYPGIYNQLTVRENLQYYADIYRIENNREKIDELLGFMDLRHRQAEMASRLSKGMRQKLALARMLLHDPDLLFFDEPSSGLDPIFQREVRALIQKLAQKEKTIFLSSHNLHEVEGLCSRIAIIKDGTCLAVETLDYFHKKFAGNKKEVSFQSPEDRDAAAATLAQLGMIKEVMHSLKLEILLNGPDGNKEVELLLQRSGIAYERVENGRLDLEDIFNILM